MLACVWCVLACACMRAVCMRMFGARVLIASVQPFNVHFLLGVPACLCLVLFNSRDQSASTVRLWCLVCKSSGNARAVWWAVHSGAWLVHWHC